jgi:N-methylhydantoinase B
MRSGQSYRPPHLSKDQDIILNEGDLITVRTPGGGGYGDPFKREPELVARDVRRGYFDTKDAREEYGVVLNADLSVDAKATLALRSQRDS